MATKPIVIVHGWSDSSESFASLARYLARETGRPTEQLWLGDYISLDDDVRMSDLVAAMEKAWLARGLSRAANSVDMVVHSTGGLVVRDWMYSYYSADKKKPPVQNLVMLAPANFGSPLAHKGRSLIGRVVKGSQSNKPFQTGEEILKALEMASRYTWELALQDRFSANAFSSGGVRCTVIVGNTGYSGIRGLANEDGSDGTVYVATANLNCAKVSLKVGKAEGKINAGKIQPSLGDTAFLVLDGYDHSTVTGGEDAPDVLGKSIVRGLEVVAGEFAAWRETCAAATTVVMETHQRRRHTELHGFQNTVFRVMDDQGAMVKDYTVEFYGEFTDDKDRWAQVFNKDISGKTHPYGDNPAYRSFRINVTRLYRELDRNDQHLKISLSALPDVTDERTLVGYKSVGVDDIGQWVLSNAELRQLFQANRTVLVDICLPRHQKDAVFTLYSLKK